MSYPASEISSYSSFRVHGFGSGTVLRQAITSATSLLEPLRVPVQGPSGREAPTPYFWKTTLALISSDGAPELERIFPDLEDRDPLILGIASAAHPAISKLGTQIPDLWFVPVEEQNAESRVAGEWKLQGNGAVVALHPLGTCAWTSHNAAFGQSRGFLQRDLSGDAVTNIGNFIGGLVWALLEELLGENLFNKASVRVERECLEMRPLHLGRAVESGLAAATVMMENITTNGMHKKGEALGKVRQQLRAWRGPESQGWGARGR